METDKIPADGLIKVLPKAKLDQFIRQYNLVNVFEVFTFTFTF